MHILKRFLTSVATAAAIVLAAATGGATAQDSAIAITHDFGDGQRLFAVAVVYDQEIDNSKLTASAFTVEGRNVARVFANNSIYRLSGGGQGKYVILQLSRDDPNEVAVKEGEKRPSLSVRQAGDVASTSGRVYPPGADAIPISLWIVAEDAPE